MSNCIHDISGKTTLYGEQIRDAKGKGLEQKQQTLTDARQCSVQVRTVMKSGNRPVR